MILVVGGSPEDGRWLEDALKPSGLAVTVRSLEDALAPPPSETRVRPEVLVLHERRRREDLLESLDRLHADPALGETPLVVQNHSIDSLRWRQVPHAGRWPSHFVLWTRHQ